MFASSLYAHKAAFVQMRGGLVNVGVRLLKSESSPEMELKTSYYLAKRRAFCKICFLVEMFVYLYILVFLYIFFFVTIFSNFNSLCRSQF